MFLSFNSISVLVEHILASIVSLLLHTKGSDLQRVLHKFTEENGAKIERLVDLFEKNNNRTKIVEKQIFLLQKERNETYQDYNPEDDEAEFDLLRLESGLYALQMTCVIICFVFVLSEKDIQEKVKSQISLQGAKMDDVYKIVYGTCCFT